MTLNHKVEITLSRELFDLLHQLVGGMTDAEIKEVEAELKVQDEKLKGLMNPPNPTK